MPVIHEPSKPPRTPWLRADRIAAIGLVVGVVLTISGWFISGGEVSNNSNSVNSNNTTVRNPDCYQLCGDTYVGQQQAVDESPYANPGHECRQDRNDESAIAGWGPARNLLAADRYSDFPSFNLDNSPDVVGDERGFYSARDASEPTSNWSHIIHVERGKSYLLRIYVHNSGLEAMKAIGTRVFVNLPTCSGLVIPSAAFIRADNTEPKEIYGGVTFVGDELFNLAYENGSLTLCSNHFSCKPPQQGAPLTEDFFTSRGALIGYDALNGTIPGGYQYAAYISYRVHPQFVD